MQNSVPLYRHSIADNDCRNVSIASPQTKDHTGDMTRQSINIVLFIQIILKFKFLFKKSLENNIFFLEFRTGNLNVS